MSDRDDRLMTEAYDQVNEGIFDRMKAKSAGKDAYKAAGGKTGMAGLGQKARAGIANVVGGQLNSKEKTQMAGAKTAQQFAQLNALVAGYAQKIQADLQKINVDANGIEDDALRTAIQTIINYKAPEQAQAPEQAPEQTETYPGVQGSTTKF